MKALGQLRYFAIIFLLAALFAISPYGHSMLMAASQTPKEEMTAQADMAENVSVKADETAAGATATSGDELNVKDIMTARTMGDPNAPVKIQEFTSLSCPHCAHFNQETFPEIKKNYIDTGKVFFTYTDFPLNAPALEAAVISHCLPKDRYSQFVDFLFGTQDQWAFKEDYKKILEQNAKLLGLTEERAEACENSDALRMALITRMQKAQKDHEVQATPSFLFNGNELMTGASGYDTFSKKIDAMLEGVAKK